MTLTRRLCTGREKLTCVRNGQFHPPLPLPFAPLVSYLPVVTELLSTRHTRADNARASVQRSLKQHAGRPRFHCGGNALDLVRLLCLFTLQLGRLFVL